MSSDDLLPIALAVAVPLWIHQMRNATYEQLQEEARNAQDVIAHHGDVILYRGKKKGETADAFNSLAKAIAILSFMPGGVTCFGQHWESTQGKVMSCSIVTPACIAEKPRS